MVIMYGVFFCVLSESFCKKIANLIIRYFLYARVHYTIYYIFYENDYKKQ